MRSSLAPIQTFARQYPPLSFDLIEIDSKPTEEGPASLRDEIVLAVFRQIGFVKHRRGESNAKTARDVIVAEAGFPNSGNLALPYPFGSRSVGREQCQGFQRLGNL